MAAQRCSVWLVVTWSEEVDFDQEYYFSKANYDQVVHGAYFCVRAANRAARALREQRRD